MKLGNIEVVATLTLTKKCAAIVQKFRRGKNMAWGIAKDVESGSLIYFRMNRCHTFMVSSQGPVFTGEYKDVCPKKGDILVYILDNSPVETGKLPSMLFWNYEESYRACLAECTKLFVCDRSEVRDSRLEHQPQVHTTHMQLTATNGHEDHGVRAKKFSKHRHNHRTQKIACTSPEEKNWGYKVAPHMQNKRPEPKIDLSKELLRE